jgi:hypothetical protein
MTEATMWVASHDGVIAETAPTKASLLWLLRANHLDTRDRTVTRTVDGYEYVAPRGERYQITTLAKLTGRG